MLKQIAKRLIPNVVKRGLCEALRPAGGVPARVRNLIAFQGPFSFAVSGKTVKMMFTNRWIENDLFWKGISGYEQTSVQAWMALAGAAKTVLDIGANTGLFSLLAKSANPTADVWAFEPLPRFCMALQENVQLNGGGIHVFPLALSNFSGGASFFVPPENQGNVYSSSLSLEHYLAHQTSKPTEHKVAVVLADDFVRTCSIKDIELVKIDAEGHDAEVLEGMKQVIEASHPDFLLEVQSDAVANKMMRWLDAEDYDYYLVDEDRGLLPVERLSQGPGLNVLACWRQRAGSRSSLKALLAVPQP